MQQPRPGLSDPTRAAIAWTRFARMMRWMAVAAGVAIAVALVYLQAGGGVMTIHMVIATIAGVGLSVMLASALMLLAFLSSGTGHDEAAAAPFEDER